MTLDSVAFATSNFKITFNFQSYNWVDNSPLLHLQMADLNAIDFTMLTTSTYRKDYYSEATYTHRLNHTIFTIRIKNIVKKIRYVQKTSNRINNLTRQCGAVFHTLLTRPEWVLMNCDDIFFDNHFLCESKFATPVGSSHVYKRKSHWCSRHWVYLDNNCWNITDIIDTKLDVKLSNPPDVELQRYLTMWSLGHNLRSNIIVYAFSTSRTCFTTNAFLHQRLRLWTLRKSCLQKSYYILLRRELITSDQDCKLGVHQKCRDGTCILTSYVCDGYSDCADNSDEMNCDGLCSRQAGIRALASNSSDDTTVTTTIVTPRKYCFMDCAVSLCTCAPMYFQCNTGVCVPLQIRCDGYQDCSDGADELHCLFIVNHRRHASVLNHHLGYEV